MSSAPPGSKTSAKPLVRIPLQVGTTAAWAAARASLGLLPGLGFLILFFYFLDWSGDAAGDAGEIVVIPLIGVALFFGYSGFYARIAWRARASDLLVYPDGVRIEDGLRASALIPWTELSAPYARVDQGREMRLALWKLAITAVTRGEVDPEEKMQVWHLRIWRGGKEFQLAESDRKIEAASMRAAAATLDAVVEGRRFVEQAAAIPTEFARCPHCGAPLIPEPKPMVTCVYCKASAPLPESVQEQARAALQLAGSRARANRMVQRLLEQPSARVANLGLLLFALVMFAPWPVSWVMVGLKIWHGKFETMDAVALGLPLVAVLAGFFFARAWLAGRGAMQLLSLSYGALAPTRDGEPPRCRCCHAPLLVEGVGGVVMCRYCHADNIAGIDLRPAVDKTRGEQKRFDHALELHRRERWLWSGLAVVAGLAFAVWLGGTRAYWVSARDAVAAELSARAGQASALARKLRGAEPEVTPVGSGCPPARR